MCLVKTNQFWSYMKMYIYAKGISGGAALKGFGDKTLVTEKGGIRVAKCHGFDGLIRVKMSRL